MALREVMWTKPREGYSYSSRSAHVASMVLRRLTGMELQEYIDEKLAKPMGWGPWGYATRRGERTLPHTPGGGSCAVRSTDALRFVYLLLNKGRWGKQQHRQYDPALTGLQQTYKYDGSRDNWKPAARSQFSDGPIGTDDGVRRVLEMAVASVVQNK